MMIRLFGFRRKEEEEEKSRCEEISVDRAVES